MIIIGAEGLAEPRDFQQRMGQLPGDEQRWMLRDNGFRLVGRLWR